MNTRNITKYMLLVLLFLIVLIALSLFNKNNNEEELDDIDEETNIEGDYFDEDEIILNDFSNLFKYYPTFEDGVKSRDEISNVLKEYKTPSKNFMVQNETLDIDMLSFNIISLDDEKEIYQVSITNEQTIVARVPEVK